MGRMCFGLPPLPSHVHLGRWGGGEEGLPVLSHHLLPLGFWFLKPRPFGGLFLLTASSHRNEKKWHVSSQTSLGVA